MADKYSIKEVSELFHVPKSTLRYWEKEHIIGSNRNDENEYREYTTQDLIVIADMLFYRSLGISIKDLKDIYQKNIQDNMNLLYRSYDAIEQQIMDLKRVQEKIHKRLKAGMIYENLTHDTPTYTAPYFQNIIHLHIGTKTENVLEYIQDQSILAFVLSKDDTSVQVFGSITNIIKPHDEILWSKKADANFYPCYIKLKDGNIDYTQFQYHLDHVAKMYGIVENIIGNYLITDKSDDYYQVWIEYKAYENKN